MRAQTTIAYAAEEFVRARRSRREISSATARNYEDSLRLFTRHVGPTIPLRSLKREHVESWVEAQEALAPKTVLVRLSALRGLCSWAFEKDLVLTDPTRGVRGPRLREPLPRALGADQMCGVLHACRNDRERVIVLLMCQEMLRRGEVALLRLGDVDSRRRSMIVQGKGGWERQVPISDQTWEVIERLHPAPWSPTAPLVPHARITGKPLPPKRVGQLVSAVLQRAGVAASGHTLRHTGAADMIDTGADIREVQAALGHKHLGTTEIYVRRVDLAQLRRAMSGRWYGGGPPLTAGDM